MLNEFVIAECAIRQLHANFSDAVWRQDADDFASCFSLEGIWKIGGREMSGRDQIRSSVGAMLSYCHGIQLLVQTPQLSIDGNHAVGRTPMVEFSKPRDGPGLMTIGYYHDEYVYEDTAWLFSKRHWSLKYRGLPDLSGALIETPNYGSFPGAPAIGEETHPSVKISTA